MIPISDNKFVASQIEGTGNSTVTIYAANESTANHDYNVKGGGLE